MPTHMVLMPSQRFELEQWATDLTEQDLIRHYWLSDEDHHFIDQHRGAHNRLGVALQLAYLRYPGWPLGPQELGDSQVVAYLARQLRVDPRAMHDYAQRPPTQREHFATLIYAYGYTPWSSMLAERVITWLFPHAIQRTHGATLVQQTMTYLRNQKIVLPALSTLEDLVWQARDAATTHVYTTLTVDLTAAHRAALDALLEITPDQRITPLAWLRTPPGKASAVQMNMILDRLDALTALDLPPLTLEYHVATRFPQLAKEGRRYSPQGLRDTQVPRRYAILVAFLTTLATKVVDQAIEMHDAMMADIIRQATKAVKDRAEDDRAAQTIELQHYVQVGTAMITAHDQQQDVVAALESVITWDGLRESISRAQRLIDPNAINPVAELDRWYSTIRRYARRFLATLTFQAAPIRQSVVDALNVLRALDSTNQQLVPYTAPRDFIPPKWEDFVFQDARIHRHYYELCSLNEVRQGLRAGDIWVNTSQQYQAFDHYLITDAAWEQRLADGFPSDSLPDDPDAYLGPRLDLLHRNLAALAQQAADGTLPDVTLRRGILHVSGLESMSPADVDAVLQPVYARVPPVNITDLLAEVDDWTQMSQHFHHLHSDHGVSDVRVAYAAILGDGLNLGFRKMAQSCPSITYERLQWFAEWFLRADTYANATSAIINLQHRLPLAQYWGDGTTSSSDGVDFPTAWGGRRTGRINAHYGGDPAAMFYGFVSDQYGPFWMRPIPITDRQAPYAVEGLLSHRTQLRITEHSTDTTGYTDHIFAVFHLLGWRFAPRIRDMSRQRLFTPTSSHDYAPITPMLAGPINSHLIRTAWPELCRLARTLRTSYAPPVTILKKLAAYPRQHGLALALREVGRVERTLYDIDWFQQLVVRQRVGGILNKGEGKNNLEQAVFVHRHGKVHDRSVDDQVERASGLNLVLAAIVLWNTVYLGAALEQARAAGHVIPEHYVSHLSPLGWEHINLTGDYVWRPRRPLVLPPLIADA